MRRKWRCRVASGAASSRSVRPLVAGGIGHRPIIRSAPIVIYLFDHRLRGGGEKMIASWRGAGLPRRRDEEPALLRARPRPQASAGNAAHDRRLPAKPLFTPIVGNFAQGMVVVPLPLRPVEEGGPGGRAGLLAEHYAGQTFVKVMPLDAAPLLDNVSCRATTCNDTNRAELFVFGP